ncbi:hypothetical protein AcV7_009603 [Taiwanofungus camphoratus]|nr:hypothetical protein AcV7_009603 [Antrodia cinnamomea]
MAMSVDEGYRNVQREDEEDVTAAALAAVASSRRSPTSSGGKKTRQPLPREFRERDRRGSDGKQPNGEPSTPHRHRDRSLVGRASPSPKKGTGSTYSDPSVHTSPRRPGASRFSTVRELTRKHQTRWLSEDLSASADGEDDAAVQYSSGSGGSGRRQGHRNGSSDGLLIPSGGRSLVGEGLRAAGITKRKDTGDDPFVSGSGDNGTRSPRRTKSTGNSSVANGEWDTSMEQSEGARSSTHLGEGVGLSRRLDPRTPAAMSHKPNDRGNYTAGILSRPGTSMAALHHESIDNPPPRTAPPALRSYKSTYLQDRDRGKNASPQVQQEPVQQRSSDRAYSSPFTTFRSSTAPLTGLGRDSNAEHRRLMLDSLGMFESHLSRLPPMGQITTNTIPELFQSAQHLVHTLDRLNSMLKTGTNKALEAQIDAEVTDQQDGIDLVDLWRQVGSDHRENLRMSDEVVRNMTGFLLGVGKVLREYSALSGQHMRSVSLDEEMTRKLTPEVGASSSGKESEGRRSRETRRSWDPAQRDSSGLLTRLSSRERNGTGARPGSSLNMLRSSGASSSEGRSVADAVGEQTPPTTLRNNVSALAASSSIRRLYTPRERSTPNVAPIMTSFESRDSLQSYEPSPTPTSRHAQSAISDRPRAFPPLAVPPSLSTLPSESLLNRNSTVSDKPNRRKVSSNSNITVRAEPSAFSSVLRPPNATTALTTHNVLQSNSPAPGSASSPHSLLRSESSGSARTNGVTFSRPSTISSSTLSNLQQQHERVMRGRAESNASSILDESPVTLAPAAMISPLSGSETERDARRRTLGARPRISLDSALEEAAAEVMNASQAATLLSSAGRKERRRTITEIFQR